MDSKSQLQKELRQCKPDFSNVAIAGMFGAIGGAKAGPGGAIAGGVLAGTAALVNETKNSADCMQQKIDAHKSRQQELPKPQPQPQARNETAISTVMRGFGGF